MICEVDEGLHGARCLRLLLNLLTLGFVVIALLLLQLHFVSYDKMKALLDGLVARRGGMGTPGVDLTQETYERILRHLPIAAGTLGICGGTLALFKHKLTRFLLDIPSEWNGTDNPFRIQFHGGSEGALEVGALLVLSTAGIFFRIWHLGRSVRYDEAWTYVEFASRPLLAGLSNYTAPNNHLLNTLLIHLSTKLLGNTLFGLRFPTLVAGCLVIPISWVVTQALYGKLAAIFAAGCVASLPTFIEFSVNARGYALQWLFILAVIWFAAQLQENPERKIAWLGFVIAAVSGIYAIPTTLIAISGVFGWMLVTTLFDREAGKLRSVSKAIALAGLAMMLLSLLLYLPPLLARGPAAIAAKELVTWQQGDFWHGLAHMVQCARLRWTEGVPAAAVWILLAGLAIGLLCLRRFKRVSVTIALWVSAAIFAGTFHIFGFPRVWSYLLLSAVMTASAGLSLALTAVAGSSPVRGLALAALTAITFTVVVGSAVIRQRALFTSNETGMIIDGDSIVEFLSAELRPGDSLVGNAIINYELLRRSPRLYGELGQTQTAARVVAVVAKNIGTTEFCNTQSLVPLLAAQDSADPGTLAQEMDLKAYGPPEVAAKFLTSTVFSFERNRQAPVGKQ